MHHFATAYLAPVSYYAKLYAAEEARIEQWEHYVKQTYRNRCVIATAQGPLPLTIPTESNGGEKCLMRDVRISDPREASITSKQGSFSFAQPRESTVKAGPSSLPGVPPPPFEVAVPVDI